MSLTLIDCTLRDGGYYNAWDFKPSLIDGYLKSMAAINVGYVEIGFRSFEARGFKGAAAYSTDEWIRSLPVPAGLRMGVMVNASEIVNHPEGVIPALKKLFRPANESPVALVRLACHIHEFEAALPGCEWLKQQGYKVGINLMQIADRAPAEVEEIAKAASKWTLDALYFADSMGSMTPRQTAEIIQTLRKHWKGALGIHTHDNMGFALSNSIRAVEEGVTWVDGTVTGMGRGPGNVKTEYLAIEFAEMIGGDVNVTPLLEVIKRHFAPMQVAYGWGSNPYYFLAGKYGIHPTYVQEMLSDPRYSEEDLLAVIDYLKSAGGKKFNAATMEAAKNFYSGEPRGSWMPATLMAGRDVLILGTGPGIAEHRAAIEAFITKAKPVVISLNTQTEIHESLIDLRAACHPVRLLADCAAHSLLPQPLITPSSMLPKQVVNALSGKSLLDFGIAVESEKFVFSRTHATLPTSLVIAYSLAVATSGEARKVYLAGFDGYPDGDRRNQEMDDLLKLYRVSQGALPLISITPTKYAIDKASVYALC